MSYNTEYDVIVVGGGSAGVAAAAAAARKGVRTCLIEKYGFLGGQATSACVGTICGLSGTPLSETLKLAGQFASEFVSRLAKLSPREFITYKNRLTFLPYDAWAFEKVCYDLIQEAGVALYLHATCIEVRRQADLIKNVTIFSNGDTRVLSGHSFIDASGEAVISKLADLPCLREESYQAPGFVSRVSNISNDKISEEDLSLSIMNALLIGEAAGQAQLKQARVSVVPGSFKQNSCLLKLALPFERDDTLEQMTEIETFSRNLFFEIYQYLKANHGDFLDSELSMVSSQCGFRTGPRGLGRYVLAEDDILTSRKTGSYIANGLWPIEIWDSSRKPKITYSTDNDYYQIPFKSIVAEGVSNLYFAGRGLSADKVAISSARVIGTSLATGYASGFMAQAVLQENDEIKAVEQLQLEQYSG